MTMIVTRMMTIGVKDSLIVTKMSMTGKYCTNYDTGKFEGIVQIQVRIGKY